MDKLAYGERLIEIATDDRVYVIDQFKNEDALTLCWVLAIELQTEVEPPIDAFRVVTGTGGLLAGVSRELCDLGAKVDIVALEPGIAPLLSEGRNEARTSMALVWESRRRCSERLIATGH